MIQRVVARSSGEMAIAVERAAAGAALRIQFLASPCDSKATYRVAFEMDDQATYHLLSRIALAKTGINQAQVTSG